MDVLSEVFEVLLAAEVDDAQIDLCLAAFDGSEKLGAVLAGESETSKSLRPTPPAADSVVASDGVFLTSIEVKGFRGIGPLATLALTPGPGLTFVTGRNGSGKSSFAEALEVALTGTVSRFARSAVWKNGWRNIHFDEPALIRLSCLVPSSETTTRSGDTVIERVWPSDDLDSGSTSAQRAGSSKSTFDQLGWGPALKAMRPLLTNGELESLLGSDKPTLLHDRLGVVLGLDDVDAAIALLNTQAKTRSDVTKSVEAERVRITALLGSTDDTRAGIAIKALAKAQLKKDVGLSTLRGLIDQSPELDGEFDGLKLLMTLRPVNLERVASLATRALDLTLQLQEVDTAEAQAAGELVRVLDAALAFHPIAENIQDCPICLTANALNDDWHHRATALKASAKEQSARLREVQMAVKDLASEAMGLAEMPSAITSTRTDGDAELETAWRTWAVVSANLVDVGALTSYATEVEVLAHRVDDLRAEYQERVQLILDERDAGWKPFIEPIAQFIKMYKANISSAEDGIRLKDAAKTLQEAATTLRNSRLEPVRDKARHYWELMRQSSSVSLQDIRLEGSGNGRKVSFDVAIDESHGQALGVMSQGELNALALSVFLPRATSVESPFRFVVIDDPVQAMDPSKVDGLAKVLNEVASTHQVVVFTHDQRLIDAAENLGIASTVLAVQRSEQSVVSVDRRTDEAIRLLAAAKTMAMSSSAPDEVRRRVVPHLCRQAIESVITSKYRRAQLRDGLHPDEVETALQQAQGIHPRMALALGVQSAEVYATINRRYDQRSSDLFRRVKEEGHSGAADISGLVDMVHDCTRFVDRLRG